MVSKPKKQYIETFCVCSCEKSDHTKHGCDNCEGCRKFIEYSECAVCGAETWERDCGGHGEGEQ